MISKSDIVEAIRVQRERLRKFQSFRRDLLLSLPPLVADYALIISGIRRCGKSTLLAQLSVDRYKPEEVLSLNFDTPLLYGFEFSDFRIVDEVIKLLRNMKGVSLFFLTKYRLLMVGRCIFGASWMKGFMWESPAPMLRC